MTNLDKVIRVLDGQGAYCGQCSREPGDPLDDCRDCAAVLKMYAQALADAGLLMPGDMTTEYGVWWQLPNEEGISWERVEADLTQMLKNLRKHGYKAEKVSRFVSSHRFITLTEEPK